MDVNDLPDKKFTAQGTLRLAQSLTAANLLAVLTSMGIRVRYNVMRYQTVLLREGMTDSERDQEILQTQVVDTLTMLDITCHKSLIMQTLGVLGRADKFHPMQDWIVSAPWDGEDRLAALAGTVPTQSALWPVYLRKWGLQVVEAARGWEEDIERSLPHVLVFVGGQGAGKGRWVRSLLPEQFVTADAELHLSGPKATDHQIQVLRYPVAELGEIDSTFRKSDVSSLKSFLSRARDHIREPYEAKSTARLRNTVFIGTVNNTQFLNDPTGTRRFWPVGVDAAITWDHGLDLQQLWAQVNVLWEAGEEWNLTADEQKMRVYESIEFVSQSAEVDMVEAHWNKYGPNDLAAMNKTDIMIVSGVKTMNRAASADVAEWLRGKFGAPSKKGGKRDSWLFPLGAAVQRVPHISKASAELLLKHVRNLPSWDKEEQE